MTNGHTQFKSKQIIKETIGQYFSDVSLNKDTEAILFKNQFPSPQEQQPKPVTINQTSPQGLTIKELSDSIQHQQNHKKEGPVNNNNECFKNLPEHMLTKLSFILNAINLGCTPLSWQTNLTKLIYKKGNALEIKNYRPITHLTPYSKYGEKYC